MQDTKHIYINIQQPVLNIFICFVYGNPFRKNIQILSAHIEKPQNKKVRCKKDHLWQIFDRDFGKWLCMVKLKYKKAQLAETHAKSTGILILLILEYALAH